jgi:hypothetical protein
MRCSRLVRWLAAPAIGKIKPGMRLSHQHRAIALGIATGLLGLFIVLRYVHDPLGTPGPDVDQDWWMARQLLAGHDPYEVDRVQRVFATLVYYPLTAAVVVMPLAVLPLEWMRVVFVTGSAVLFGYAVAITRPHLWPALLGTPFLISLVSAQWAPLLVSAMLFPAAGWLAAVKPNLGVVMLAGARTRRDALILVGGGLIVFVISLAILPQWPAGWLGALEHSTHFKPLIARRGGWLVLLAALRWREPEARVLLALALVPVSGLVYDLLPVYLVCRTSRQAGLLSIITYIPWFSISHAHGLAQQMWIEGERQLWFVMLPALAILLWRSIPEDWVPRLARRIQRVA